MAAGTQDQVQEYLQKHKIGNLFEELMAKVVSDMPNEPIFYMIQTLERKAARSGNKAFLRRSMGDFGGISVAKDRTYEKPWQTNTKRQKNKKPGDSPSKKGFEERPEWDNKAKLKSSTFDEFWEDGVRPAGRAGTTPVKAKNQLSWADEGEHEDLLYSCDTYGGPHRPYDTDTDPLAGEFSLIAEKTEPRAIKKTKISSRYKGPKATAEKHRQVLQGIIHKKQLQADSGIDDDANQHSDDALEIMEDADELMSEGAKNVKKSGVKFRHSSRSVSQDPAVKISICGRCAKVMTGGNIQESEPISEVRVSPGLTTDDDEFESVSQVNGPRHPVWQNSDSDDETLPSRRGFSARGSEVKAKQGMRATISDTRSVESSPLKGHSAFIQTWSPDTQLTPETDEMNDDESAAMSYQGSGWGRPPTTEPTDNDSDISMPVRRGSKGKIRKYQGQF